MKNKSVFLDSTWFEKEKRVKGIYYYNEHKEPRNILSRKLSDEERELFVNHELFRNTFGDSVIQFSNKIFENSETGEQVVMPWIETFGLPNEDTKKQLESEVQVHSTGAIICPECRAIAFTKEDTPKWMSKGYCFRCGQLIKWEW